MLVALLTLVVIGVCGCANTDKSSKAKVDDRNLAMKKGVVATCDSMENEVFSADKIIDGDCRSTESRWSSENNREDASHYVQIAFPDAVPVEYVVLHWERRNVTSYAIEGSLDGVNFHVLKAFQEIPRTNRQEIVLDESSMLRYLRVTTADVTRNEEDLSLYYQNVSLYEVQVYEKAPTACRIEKPQVQVRVDGSRTLSVPKVPDGYGIHFIGSNMEQVISDEGDVYDTIEDKTVTVGYRVFALNGEEPAHEVTFEIEVPAKELVFEELIESPNECPNVTPQLAEWRGGEGQCRLNAYSKVVVDEAIWSDDLRMSLETLFAHVETGLLIQFGAKAGEPLVWPVLPGSVNDLQDGDIFLSREFIENGLGDEGYTINIKEYCNIQAPTDKGLLYGMITVLQMTRNEKGRIPQGTIRDYPIYDVRGFGIDVARKKVSMEMLYDILWMMSYYKMNDLEIHLNDNTILTTSEMVDSIDHALQAESAFRIESNVQNDQGVMLTSTDYAYTKAAFRQFILDAKKCGVNVVPEFDTPAHSLAITKLFPKYALKKRNESVDQIDLSKSGAKKLVKSIWDEMLTDEKAPFADADIINIGMDEYYGDGEQFRKYMSDTAEFVKEQGKTVRLWGSLSNVEGNTMPAADNLQMNIWSLDWADPEEMYEAGYSLINMQSNHLYLIPGGGYDHLDLDKIWSEWEPYLYYDDHYTQELPACSNQVLGAAYMLWNDMSESLDVGLCEYDLYQRFEEALPVFSSKLWGQRRTEEKPSAWIHMTKEDRLLPNYTIHMRVLVNEDITGSNTSGKGQVLAKGTGAYDDWKFFAVEPESGKVGFCMEGRTYLFNYELPKGDWVNVTVEGTLGQTSLYINGKLIETLGSKEAFEEHATFVFPLEKLGKETSSFDGKLEITTIKQGE